MFNIGFGEMLIIIAIALVVMGPERFPEFMKIALRFLRDIRTYWEEAQRELAKELRPIENELKTLTRLDTETYTLTPYESTVPRTTSTLGTPPGGATDYYTTPTEQNGNATGDTMQGGEPSVSAAVETSHSEEGAQAPENHDAPLAESASDTVKTHTD